MALLSDTSCKQVFAFAEVAKELLCAAVNQEWAHAIPLTAFERVNASYISETGKHRHDDLVWRIHRLGGSDLYLIVEFQTRPDQRMAERMQAYAALLSEDLSKQGRSGDLQILPIVFYTGRVRWQVKTCISTTSFGAPGFKPLESQFAYLLIDRDSVQDSSNIVHLVLRLNQATREQELRLVLEKLNLWCKHQSNQQLVRTVEALVDVKLKSETKCPIFPPATTLGEVIEMFDTQSQCFIEYFKAQTKREERIKGMWEGRKHGRKVARAAGRREGLEEGLEKGREEGREEGRIEWLQDLIHEMLSQRGIQLSPLALERFKRADLAALNSWKRQLIANEVPPELKA